LDSHHYPGLDSHHYPIAFSPLPRLTGTFPSKQFRNCAQTNLTLKKELAECRKSFIIRKTEVHAKKTRGAGIEVTQKLHEET